MIKAVLFDFDDTLGNRKLYTYDCYYEIVDKLIGIEDEIEKEAVIQDLLLYDMRGYMRKDMIGELYERKYKKKFPIDDFNEYWDKNQYRFVMPFDNARKLLELLKKDYKLGVITNGRSFGQNAKVEHSGLKDLLDTVIVSQDVGMHKPNADIYNEAMRRLGVTNKETVFVGDTYSSDILGAYHAGITPIWFDPSNASRSKAVIRISSLDELPELLKTL